MAHFPEWHDLSAESRYDIIEAATRFSDAWTQSQIRTIDDIVPFIGQLTGLARRALLRTILREDLENRRVVLHQFPKKSDYLQVFQDRDGQEVIEAIFHENLPPLHVELIQEIGRGGMGVVYKARQPHLNNREIALKTVDFLDTNNSYFIARLRDEIQALAQFRHNSIVAIYDVGIFQGRVAFTMELGDHDLKTHTQGKPYPDQRWVAREIRKLATALQMAHDLGIIHQDLKPSNVLVMDDGTLKISDFGLSISPSSQTDSPRNRTEGTPGYLSPEQILHKKVGPQTDVWGLGVLLYYLLAGEPPFSGHRDDYRSVLNKKLSPPSRVRRRRGGDPLDPRLEAIILKCLKKEPTDRYQTVFEVAHELQRVINDENVHALYPRWSTRLRHSDKRILAFIVLSAVLSGFLIASIIDLRFHEEAYATKLGITRFKYSGSSDELWTAFPWQYDEMPAGCYLQLKPASGEHRYILTFDGRDHASILDDSSLSDVNWNWKLTGPRIDTVILLDSNKSLSKQRHRIEESITQAIKNHDIGIGKRIQWHKGQVKVESTRSDPRGEPDTPQVAITWAKNVAKILDDVEGLRYHGWTFKVRTTP